MLREVEGLAEVQTRALRWDRLARVNESLALLEEETQIHSAALAWLIKEQRNVTDAKEWAYAQGAEL